MVLDRADALRTQPEEISRLWRDPSARVVLLHGEHVAMAADVAGTPSAIEYQSTSQLAAELAASAWFLGLDTNGSAIFGIDVLPPEQVERGSTLRTVGALLSPLDAEVFATIQGLANWHRRHPCCSMCGSPTTIERAGWVRRCPADESEHFPRTDPAVIVLVSDPADRALLGRRSVWPPGWFSTLAGFVEPGESAESAIVREVAEEASVVVAADTAVFHSSQPWPFPSSLMLGFHAEATSAADPTPDGEEIIEARWFSREELLALCSTGEVQIPSRVSIARKLIEAWFGAELPGEWSRP